MIAMAQDRGSRADDGSGAYLNGPFPNVRRAESVETVIELDRGRWAVDIVVVFPDGVVRHRIDTFATRARAELSAGLIKRAAERDLGGPLHG